MKFLYLFLLFLFPGFEFLLAQQINIEAPSGWQLKNQPVIYTPENLWGYIDGAADLFYRYQFQNLQVDYFTDTVGKYITLELYRHSNLLYTYGIYSQERPEKTEFLDIGTEGYTEPGIINFFMGDFYIKLSSNNKDEETKKSMLSIVHEIEKQITAKNTFPGTLKFFPEDGLTKHTDKFIATDFLGYEFLKEVFKTDYSVKNQNFSIFIIEQRTDSDAEKLINKLFSSQNKKFKASKNHIYYLNDKYNGELCLILKDRFLAGIIGLNNNKIRKEYSKKILESIQ